MLLFIGIAFLLGCSLRVGPTNTIAVTLLSGVAMLVGGVYSTA